jgi:hypothetical protein
VSGNGYRARGVEPLGLTAEGDTPDEAVRKLRQLLQDRLAAGARLVALEFPAGDNPWRQMAGMFKDDPLFDDWQKAIAEYRKEVEEDPNYP